MMQVILKCQSFYTGDTGNTYMSVILHKWCRSSLCISHSTQMMHVIPMHQSCYTDDAGNPYQGSSHFQKIGRHDFTLREHEGEAKAWQWDFQQLHRDMFLQKCVVSLYQFLKIAFEVSMANILLISFIFNFKFMFCICIIVADLIFVDFRFYSFRLEICKTYVCILPLFP